MLLCLAFLYLILSLILSSCLFSFGIEGLLLCLCGSMGVSSAPWGDIVCFEYGITSTEHLVIRWNELCWITITRNNDIDGGKYLSAIFAVANHLLFKLNITRVSSLTSFAFFFCHLLYFRRLFLKWVIATRMNPSKNSMGRMTTPSTTIRLVT
jgi:hypothetical protein